MTHSTTPFAVIQTAADRYARTGLRDLPKGHRSSRYAFNLLCLIGAITAVFYTVVYLLAGQVAMAWGAFGVASVVILPLVAGVNERWAGILGITIVNVGFTYLSYMAGRDSLVHFYVLLGLINIIVLRGSKAPVECVLAALICTVVAGYCQVYFETPALGNSISDGFITFLAVIGLVGLAGMTTAVLLMLSREVARAQEALAAEHARSEALLHNLLPDEIAERLKNNPREIIADGLPAVTLLFADIVDFTPRSARMTPDGLVGFLSRIFSAFDALTEERGLEKIKTIGDAYMVAAGLPAARVDHAHIIADMALAMQAEMKRLSDEMGEIVELRIGIHSGPAVAGVIGTAKVFYDVWGDTVNTASRLESHGEPGRIQVTGPTKAILGDAYSFASRGRVEIKGMGEIETWWLMPPAA